MKYVYAIIAVILMSHVFCGCATFFNGSTQDVPVKVPEGTTITDFENNSYPISIVAFHEDTTHYIRLRRKHSVPLRFTYKDQTIISAIPMSIEAAWPIAQFLYIIPFIVDAQSEAWNTYDGVEAVFDSVPHLKLINQSAFHVKPGVVVQFGLGAISANQAILFFNNYQIGVGFHYYDKWMIQFTLSASSYVDFLQNEFITKAGDTHLRSYQLEGRYYPYGGFYLSGGGGVRTVIDNAVPKVNIGTAFLGFGYSGRLGYVEWRHTPSLMKNTLLGGTSRVLSTTEVNFGFNLFF